MLSISGLPDPFDKNTRHPICSQLDQGRFTSSSLSKRSESCLFKSIPKGEIIVMMDADGQNDPSDIPKLLDMIKNGGFDVVSGWRYKRNDGFFRVFFSKIANKLLSFILNLKPFIIYKHIVENI